MVLKAKEVRSGWYCKKASWERAEVLWSWKVRRRVRDVRLLLGWHESSRTKDFSGGFDAVSL